MGSLKQWIPLITTVLGGVLTALTPQITGWVQAHPDTAVLLSTIFISAAHFVTPPDTTPAAKG